jgi:hypothetical protein
LRLVDVDEDARVTERATAAVALDDAVLGPVDGLLVDELNGCQRARLWRRNVSVFSFFLIQLHSLADLGVFLSAAYTLQPSL